MPPHQPFAAPRLLKGGNRIPTADKKTYNIDIFLELKLMVDIDKIFRFTGDIRREFQSLRGS